jgi:RecG-like helicase
VDLSLRRRLELTVAEVDSRRLQDRFAKIDVSQIVDVEERRPARFGGEVRSQHRRSADGQPLLRVTVTDGTGTAVAVFTGRSRISGLEVGRIVLLEGVARRDEGQLIVMNPAYTLLP